MVLVQKELKAAYIGEWYVVPISISLDKSSISLTTVGQTEQLTATILPADARQTVTWTSSNTSIATVDNTGLVTCVTPGDATITATTVNGLTATCSVGTTPPGMDLLTNVKYYFPMMGDIKDYSGNNADLTRNAGTVTYGTNYNTLSSALLRNNAVSYTGNVQTIGIRCRLTSGNSQFLSAGYDGNGSTGWGMGINTTKGEYVVSSSGYSTGSYTSIQDSIWHLMIFTYNGTTATMYKDGSQLATGSRSGSVRSVLGISIGSYGYGSTRYTGDIGITFLTNSAMSASDVLAFYNATKSIYGK